MTDKQLVDFLKRHDIIGLTRTELKKFKKAFEDFKRDSLLDTNNYDTL